ncbi:MAG: glycosyltransferase family 87 protein [Candidatus Limnocylindrales bacterium]
MKQSMGFDVVSYWRLDLADPYHGRVGDLGFFPYSPAVALLFAPFAALPWQAFATLWYGVLLGALAFLGRRSMLVLLAFPPVAIDLYHGNIHLLLAAAIVVGFRYPAAWSFVLLAKVTPGIGLLWFLFRREWRSLGIALGATAAIAAVTAVVLPTQWAEWLTILVTGAATPPPAPALPIPIWLRLPVAAAILYWGAKGDARWVVPVAAALSVPALWPGALAILAACWPLTGKADASAAASQQDPDYHAADARQSRGEREPVTA